MAKCSLDDPNSCCPWPHILVLIFTDINMGLRTILKKMHKMQGKLLFLAELTLRINKSTQ